MRDEADRRARAQAQRQAIGELLRTVGDRQTRELARAFGLKAALRYLDATAAQQHARRLLGAGSPRPEIHRRLVEAHGMSQRQAQRITSEELRQGRPRAVA